MFMKPALKLSCLIIFLVVGLQNCKRINESDRKRINELKEIGLKAEIVYSSDFLMGKAPKNFYEYAGATYKPAFNSDPGIPPQCWIETGYGTQNACKYCHTNYLAEIGHGNSYPIAEDQVLYSFPNPNMNHIWWQNILNPQEIENRLAEDGIPLPNIDDVEYVRKDNWLPAFLKAQSNGKSEWFNSKVTDNSFALFPALDPRNLFPFKETDPTNGGKNGYIDLKGFVRNNMGLYTGWRAVSFFPYSIFTPVTGSVSGIYIRLPISFMCQNGIFDELIYSKNLEILEKNIKNQNPEINYVGDASSVIVKKGFYPVGTEFAHPLHYADLNADGETGLIVDGVSGNINIDYEFPGTRSKRLKEIRYMYKWKDVGLDDIKPVENKPANPGYIGNEGQGWVDNGAGWIIAGFIENRWGNLRHQTTEELAQCVGCHSKTGNTIDAVWSFQRKLPGTLGWSDMNYGGYNSSQKTRTLMPDYKQQNSEKGEKGNFFHSVVGADLYGIMPVEMKTELKQFAEEGNIVKLLGLQFSIDEILDDEILKYMAKDERKPRLLARQKLMRYYSSRLGYLYHNKDDDNFYIKGNILYPTVETMKSNIFGYRKIVLDQSFNLGKDVFGSQSDHVPFTFRSDGTVRDENGRIIPVGNVIYSRPYNKLGIGTTPTGIIAGEYVDKKGNVVKEGSDGAVGLSGTLDMYYNPVLGEKKVEAKDFGFDKLKVGK